MHSTIGSTVHSMPLNSLEHYMHNHEDKYPARPGFEPGTSRLQAPVDIKEPAPAGSQEPITFIAPFSAPNCSKAWSVQCCLRFPHLVNRGLKAQLAHIGIGFRIRSFKTPIAVNENSTYSFFSNLISSGSNSLTKDFKTLVVFQNAKKCVSKHQNRLQLCCNHRGVLKHFFTVCA